jgi:tartrate-resistant acid phosphatase type 5
MLLTKRRFLTILSSLVLAARAQQQSSRPINFLAMGDWGAPFGRRPTRDKDQDWKRRRTLQDKVALAMCAYARSLRDAGEPVDGVLALGDNFYEKLGDSSDPRWKERFEDLYPRDPLDCPFYFALGNHDYEDADKSNWRKQLAYAREVAGTRWKFPAAGDATWYRQDFGSPSPWFTLLVLNSNTDHIGLNGRSDQARWSAQSQWLAAELDGAASQNRRVLCVAHHPMFTNGFHWNGRLDPSLYKSIRRDWLPHLARIPFYLSGHDHNLQHIEHPEHPATSFLVCGAGGGDFVQPEHRFLSGEGPVFTTKFLKNIGFMHLRYSAAESTARLITADDGQPHDVHMVQRSA